MTSAEIWARNDAANVRGAEPLNNFSALMTGKSIADLARRQHLQDVASERGYEQTAAGLSSKRRMKEDAEFERLRAVKEMADQGIPVRSDMTLDELASAKREFLTTKAGTQLDVIKSQMAQAQQKQKDAFDTIHRIASSPNLGNKEQRIQALRTALNDPAAAKLPDSVRSQLWNIVSTNQDPAKAVDTAVKGLQSYGGTKGLFSGFTTKDQLSNAQGFMQAYLGPLQASATETQKYDLAAAVRGLEDANKQAETLNQMAYAHIGANAAFLPKESMTDWTASAGHPADPNAVMDKVVPKPQAAPTPAAAPTAPQTRPFAGGQPSPMQQSMSDWAGTGGFAGTGNFPGGSTTQVPSFSDLATVTSNALSNDRPDLPPGAQEINAFRAATVAQSPRPGVGGTVLVQATPEERMKAENMVRMGLRAKGLPQDQIDQFISQANQKLQSGDAQAIQQANQLLNMVRSAGNSPLASPVAAQ
jgi:hypothetical protein